MFVRQVLQVCRDTEKTVFLEPRELRESLVIQVLTVRPDHRDHPGSVTLHSVLTTPAWHHDLTTKMSRGLKMPLTVLD